MSDSERKRDEALFHDRARGVYERDPERYARYLTNKKYYSITGASTDYVDSWLRLIAPGRRVLDFGCGSGQLSIKAAQAGGRVTGIDISPESVKLASAAASSAGVAQETRFVAMDGENLQFPDHSFDAIVISGVLHHVDLRQALSEIRRVLAPSGEVLALEALADNPLIHAYRRRTPHLRTAWETEHILRASSKRTMSDYFSKVEVKYFHLAVLAAVPFRRTPLFGPMVAALNAVDRRILAVEAVGRFAWMGAFRMAQPRQP